MLCAKADSELVIGSSRHQASNHTPRICKIENWQERGPHVLMASMNRATMALVGKRGENNGKAGNADGDEYAYGHGHDLQQ